MRTAETRTVDVVALDDVNRRERIKAIARDRYGSADVLALRHVDKPSVANDDVLVRVHAAGVDRGV